MVANGDIPDDINQHYMLQQKALKDDFIYVEVQTRMHLLPQVGLLEQDLLESQFTQHGFFQSNIIPGLCCTKPIQFNFAWSSMILVLNIQALTSNLRKIL